MAVASLASSAFTRIGDEIGPEATKLKESVRTSLISFSSFNLEVRKLSRIEIETSQKIPIFIARLNSGIKNRRDFFARSNSLHVLTICIETDLGFCQR